MSETESTLIAIGELLELRSGSFGIGRKPADELSSKALRWLREELCPRKQEILGRARSSGTEVAVLLTEVLLFALGNTIPGVAKLAKAIAQLSLEKFCAEPALLVSGESDERPGEQR